MLTPARTHHILTKLLKSCFILCLFAICSAPAGALTTSAEYVYMQDFQTGEVLLEKNPDGLMYPSSMAKMMTSYLVFEKIKNGSLALEDEFLISEKAWKMQGSKMFVEVGKMVTVSDLLHGLAIQSGNDASIALAEGVAGSEAAFADMMNAKAAELGMENSHFTNATGWPDPELVTTAHDLAILGRNMIAHFPELYKIYSQEKFKFSGIEQSNRNPLLYQDIGADGIKTGHTEAAGYGLTASAEQDGRRLVLVINGLDSAQKRASEGLRLMQWGFSNFDNYALLHKDTVVDSAAVWMGDEKRVGMVPEQDILATLPRGSLNKINLSVELEEPVAAPVQKGQKLGELIVTVGGDQVRRYPLVASADVGTLGPIGRMFSYISHTLWGE